MTSVAAVAAVNVPASGLILRELSPGYVTLSGSAPVTRPVSVSANTARAGEVVQANALADDIFTLITAVDLLRADRVQLAEYGLVTKWESGLYLGHAATEAKKGQRVKVAVDLSSLYGEATGGGGSGGESAIAAPPGTEPPEGNIVATAKGQIYTQLDPTESYKVRDWTFNGTVGTATGWI